jgi:hypothetical protein
MSIRPTNEALICGIKVNTDFDGTLDVVVAWIIGKIQSKMGNEEFMDFGYIDDLSDRLGEAFPLVALALVLI